MSSSLDMNVKEVQGVQHISTTMTTVEARLEWSLDRKILESITEVGQDLKSPVYGVELDGETLSCLFILYPKGRNISCSSSISLFLATNGSLIKNASRRMIKYSLAIESKTGHVIHNVKRLASEFSSLSQGWGAKKFCNIGDLNMLELYENDKLVMAAEIIIPVEKEVHLRNKADEQIKYKSENSAKAFFQDMKSIYDMSSFSDFTVFCGDKKFLCHKAVLAARSDVFKAMLESETTEKIKNEVEIKDSSPDNVKSMIDHIYTSKIPDDLDTICEELIHLAVKYNLPNLTEACEVSLLKHLCVSNAVRRLIIVDRYRPLSSSRQDIFKYITINALDIIDTEEWERLTREHPKLVTEVVRCSVTNQTNTVLTTKKQ